MICVLLIVDTIRVSDVGTVLRAIGLVPSQRQIKGAIKKYGGEEKVGYDAVGLWLLCLF